MTMQFQIYTIFQQTLIKNNDKIFYITDTIKVDDGIKESDGSIQLSL